MFNKTEYHQAVDKISEQIACLIVDEYPELSDKERKRLIPQYMEDTTNHIRNTIRQDLKELSSSN